MHEDQWGEHRFASRGKFIVDTSVLLRLCVEINESLLAHDAIVATRRAGELKTPRYSDALIWLAYHGYEVVIPEVVAYVCAQVMWNGKSLRKYFATAEPHRFSQLTKPFFDELLELPRSDCLISIQPPDDREKSEAADYIRALDELTSSELGTRHARNKIVSLHRLHPDRRRYGDDAARGLLAHMTKPDVPIFYLTND